MSRSARSRRVSWQESTIGELVNRNPNLAWSLLPPVLFGVALVAAWQGVVQVFDLKPYFLAAPTRIFDALVDNRGNVWDATWLSGTNAVVGLVCGTVLGVAVSFLLARFRILDEVVSPLAVSLNAVPIFVLVTVFNDMFSVTSEIPRRLMVTIAVYFIVLVNVAKGLRQVQPIHVELLRSYAATPFRVLTKVRIPNAISYLFTALRIAAPAAVITAFVAEYFGGSQKGLGYGITSNISSSKNAVAWAYVIGACALGLTFFVAAVAAESVVNHTRGVDPRGETS